MITFHLPFLPPTENHAYENVPTVRRGGKIVGGGRRLSEAGRTFKLEVTNHLARHHIDELQFFKEKANTPFIVWCIFYFEELINKGYPNKTNTKYKIVDGHNRTKLLFDSIAELTGRDDSQYFDVIVSKREGTPKTEVTFWDAQQEEIVLVLGNTKDRRG
jgi:Holliday junction resolvase RusA-like endonuclease